MDRIGQTAGSRSAHLRLAQGRLSTALCSSRNDKSIHAAASLRPSPARDFLAPIPYLAAICVSMGGVITVDGLRWDVVMRIDQDCVARDAGDFGVGDRFGARLATGSAVKAMRANEVRSRGRGRPFRGNYRDKNKSALLFNGSRTLCSERNRLVRICQVCNR